jgi:MFS family permease
MNAYLEVLRTPHAWPFTLTGAVARFPNAMLSISMTLMIEMLYGRYQIAGMVSATYTISLAIGAPLVARLIDRNGQRLVGRVLVITAASAMLGLVALALLRAPAWSLCVPAVIAGVSAFPVVAMSRARWSYLLRERQHLVTSAFSWEAMLDDVAFVLGPSIGTALATTIHPVAGVICVASLLLVGGALFLGQRASEPPAQKLNATQDKTTSNKLVIFNPVVAIVCAVFLFTGTVFGSSNLAIVAFCEEHGMQWFSAILLGAGSLASMVGALIYGAIPWKIALGKRFVFLVLAFAGLAMLFPLSNSVPMLFVINFFFGALISPTFINGNAIIHQVVSPGQLTEGLTWIGTMVNVGFSIGALLAGTLIDRSGSHAGFMIVAAAGLFGAIIVASSAPKLRTLIRAHRDSTLEPVE